MIGCLACDLTAGESAELGPLLRLAAATVTALTSPEQVYVCLWSHAGGEPGHLHFVVQPVHRGDMDGHRSYGPGLQMAMFEAGVLPDPGAVEVFAGRMRDRLAQVRTP